MADLSGCECPRNDERTKGSSALDDVGVDDRTDDGFGSGRDASFTSAGRNTLPASTVTSPLARVRSIADSAPSVSSVISIVTPPSPSCPTGPQPQGQARRFGNAPMFFWPAAVKRGAPPPMGLRRHCFDPRGWGRRRRHPVRSSGLHLFACGSGGRYPHDQFHVTRYGLRLGCGTPGLLIPSVDARRRTRP